MKKRKKMKKKGGIMKENIKVKYEAKRPTMRRKSKRIN